MPVRLVTVHTRLPADEVTARLRSIVRPSRGLRELFPQSPDAPDEQPFRGCVGDRAFKIVRVIAYRNSFLPVVRGTVEPTPNGSDVRLLMTLHPLVAVFMTAWLCGVGWPLIGWLQGGRDGGAPQFSLAMLAIGFILTLGGFVPESFKVERIIRTTLGS